MLLPFNIESSKLVAAYHSLQEVIKGIDDFIIFDAMSIIAPLLKVSFSLPAEGKDYEKKYKEIENFLKKAAVVRGQDLCVLLFEKVWENVKNNEFNLVNTEAILAQFVFSIDNNTKILLSESSEWQLNWLVKPNNLTEEQDLKLILRKRSQPIVPPYIVEFIYTAISAFNKGMNSVTMVLSTIVLEGTLKDILTNKGYNFDFNNKEESKYIKEFDDLINVARNTERFLTPDIFSEDFDSVVKLVRNNLIHLSGEGFHIDLPKFNHLLDKGNYTLNDFCNNSLMVFDLLQSIIYCVNQLYEALRENAEVSLNDNGNSTYISTIHKKILEKVESIEEGVNRIEDKQNITHEKLDSQSQLFLELKEESFTQLKSIYEKVIFQEGQLFQSIDEQQKFFQKAEAYFEKIPLIEQKILKGWQNGNDKHKLKAVLNMGFIKYERELEIKEFKIPKTWEELKAVFFYEE